LPGLGTYVVSGHDPDPLFIDGNSGFMTNFSEVFDRISRNKRGEFSLAIQSCPGSWIQYMGEGRAPQSHITALPGSVPYVASYKLRNVTELRKNWYLAQYEVTVEHTSTSSVNGNKTHIPLPTGH
jgi:hypothetical protein